MHVNCCLNPHCKPAGLKQRKAFTLIELLVVIAIIAMLLSILIPALSRVKKQATSVVSMTNIRGIMQAYHVYGQDNNNTWPGSAPGNGALPSNGGDSQSWIPPIWSDSSDFDLSRGAIWEYVGKEEKVFSCPASITADKERRHLSYAVNERMYTHKVATMRDPDEMMDQFNTRFWQLFPKPDRFRSPGKVIVMIDENGCNDGWFAPVRVTERGIPTEDSLTYKDVPHWIAHAGRCPFGYADTHVTVAKEEDKEINQWPLTEVWSPTGEELDELWEF